MRLFTFFLLVLCVTLSNNNAVAMKNPLKSVKAIIGGAIDDEKRARIRKKCNISFIEDYFIRSEISDYIRIRLVLNSLIGLVLCSCLYYIGWEKLNFADFHPTFAIIFKWIMIITITVIYAISPVFRCAIFCVLIGSLGKQGQAPLTMLVVQNLYDGPIENIIHNYKLATEIVVCHLQMQATIISKKIAIFTGPLETMLKRQLIKGMKVLKSVVRTVRKFLAPFRSEVAVKETPEDERFDAEQKQLAVVSQRRLMNGQSSIDTLNEEFTEEQMQNMTSDQPLWTTFKTKIGRKIASRMSKKCNEIFANGVKQCREMFGGLQEKCYDTLPPLIRNVVCKRMKLDETCEDIDRRRQSFSICRGHLSKAKMNPTMEEDFNDVTNMTDQLQSEANINLHMMLVDAPRIEVGYSLSDVMMVVKHAVRYAKALIKSCKEFVMALFVFFIYRIFRNAVRMITNFRADVEFNNHFINSLFWKIDDFRYENGQLCLLRLTSIEMKKWKLLRIFSWPTTAEMRKMRYPFFIWLVMFMTVGALIAFDYYIYEILEQVVAAASVKVKAEGERAQIEILGEGVIADFINNIVNSNATLDLAEGMESNQHCLSSPRRPDIKANIIWLVLPLVLSLVMQVVFAFLIKRLLLNFFLPYMFPLKDRIRCIYLYNKLLFLRATDRKESRSKIRFIANRWKINHELDEGGFISTKSWMKVHILDRIFHTGQCMMCEMYMRPVRLLYCDKCPASYCKFCIEEMDGQCYACQVEEGTVNSTRTQAISVDETPRLFVTHDVRINRK